MSKENLQNREAVEKLKELAEDIRFCLFATDLNEKPIPSRPMTVQEVDTEGNIWFLSSAESDKNESLMQDPKVQLFFQKPSDQKYLSVYGHAYIYTDRATIEEKWSKMANAWFDGKDDPNVTVLRIAPEQCYYWDTKAGNLVSFLTFAAAAISGTKADNSDGVEGKLNI